MGKITQPTLLLDEEVCRANIQRMANRAKKLSVDFKPHMKTHQSAEVGQWLQAAGVNAITVSSVQMASYFAEHGWQDITIAFPCNIREIETINRLAEKRSITILVNTLTTARIVDQQLSHSVSVYIELDTGSHRTGIPTDDIESIERLVDNIQQQAEFLEFKGFYSHPGHSYNARSREEVQEIHQSVIKQIKNLRSQLSTDAFEVCIGDTPCCSLGTDFSGIDAISPGNFVFYDLMQRQIGCCTTSNIATAVACPIVDRNESRKEVAIYGGAIHFSKEKLDSNQPNYGYVARQNDMGWSILDEGTYLTRLSQEHGIVRCTEATFNEFAVGDTLTVLPVHSCLTAHLLSRYQLKNDQIITQLS